ncbi:MAG: hypothetical protein LUE24_13860 [Lachnospiraceae bacterium]|nr:hypothetical protein [Lachnospiraceae bacterium]
MTDRERELIAAYIPSPRDETLEPGCEYYVKDTAARVQRVWVTTINPGSAGEDLVYRVRNDRGIVRTGHEDRHGSIPKWVMYDNKEDCRNDTHSCYSRWEYLRKLQEEEM